MIQCDIIKSTLTHWEGSYIELMANLRYLLKKHKVKIIDENICLTSFGQSEVCPSTSKNTLHKKNLRTHSLP